VSRLLAGEAVGDDHVIVEERGHDSDVTPLLTGYDPKGHRPI
jgi:hypothetical protein